MRLFLFLVFLLLPTLAAAQGRLGARLGVNVATVAGEFATSDAAEPRYGLVGGFSLTFPLRYSFALQAEVLYAQKGFTTDEVFDAFGMPLDVESATFELTSLDVPLLVMYTLPLSRETSLGLYGGPYLGFELAERLRVEPDFAVIPGESDSFAGTDLGLTLGFDVTVVLQSIQPSLGLRYARSLSNQLEEDAAPGASAYHSVFTIFLGLDL